MNISLRTIVLFALLLAASCVTTEIKDGQTAYRLKKYHLASQLLIKEFEKSNEAKDKSEIAMLIGDSYRNFNDWNHASEWYKKSINVQYSNLALEKYALSLKVLEKYEEAINSYQQLAKEDPFRRNEFTGQIKACRQAIAWKKKQTLTDIINLKNLNSSAADFSPAIRSDGSLVFTSSRRSSADDETDQWTGQAFFNLYTVPRNHFDDSIPHPLPSPINSPFNDGPAVFSPDGNTIYFTHCGSDDKQNNDDCQIYQSYLQADNTWSSPEVIRFFEDSVNTGQATITADGNTIVFAAADPEGYGGTDLYYAVETFDGWSEPVNIGPGVNTKGNEAFPYIDDDGYLYFSSDGWPGLGGLDIYKAEPKGKVWTKATLLPWPINTGGDDFGIIPYVLTDDEAIAISQRGIFSSSRPGGKGSDDIWEYEIRKPDPVVFLDGEVLEKILSNPDDPNSSVTGFNPLSHSKLTLTDAKQNQIADTATTAEKGFFHFQIQADHKYRLMAGNEPDYLNKSVDISTQNLGILPGDTLTLQTQIVLDKIFREVFINIDNIYYDYDDWHIRPDAAIVLDSLFRILQENPTIRVELGSHTDSRGSKEYNKDLSQKRADAVVEYLTEKGIDSGRLVAKGYGESVPVNKCTDGVECTEEEYQKNRRTTFKILSE